MPRLGLSNEDVRWERDGEWGLYVLAMLMAERCMYRYAGGAGKCEQAEDGQIALEDRKSTRLNSSHRL